VRRFKDLSKVERAEAVEAVLDEYERAHVGRAQYRASLAAQSKRKRSREKSLELARIAAVDEFERELRSKLRGRAKKDAKKAWYPSARERLVHIADDNFEVLPSRSGWFPGEAWAELSLARELGWECPICDGTGEHWVVWGRPVAGQDGMFVDCETCDGEGTFAP
jgi:hypothetical protein